MKKTAVTLLGAAGVYGSLVAVRYGGRGTLWVNCPPIFSRQVQRMSAHGAGRIVFRVERIRSGAFTCQKRASLGLPAPVC